MNLVLLAFILFVILLFFPRFSFWTIVFFMTNPGGLVGNFFGKASLGGFYYMDILLILSYAFVFIRGYRITEFFSDKLAKKMFFLLALFSVYKLFVWGLIVPGYDIEYWFRYTLIRERDAIFGFLIMIPVYLFAKDDVRSFIATITTLGIVVTILGLASLILGINVIEYKTIERYRGSGIERLLLGGYGMINFLIPSAVVVYLTNLPIRYKRWFILGGVVASVNLLLSLTKNLYIYLMGVVIASIYLIGKTYKKSYTLKFLKITLLIVLFSVVIEIVFPGYLGFGKRVFGDIFLLAAEGQTSDGSTSRMWQIPAFLYEIANNPFFGTGLGYEQLSTKFDINQFDASDFPLLAHIMQYGLVGIGIYLINYKYLYVLIRECAKILQSFGQQDLKYKFEIIIVISSISYFVGYFIKIFMIFFELTNGSIRVEMSIYTGLLLAVLSRYRHSGLNNPSVNTLFTKNIVV